MSIENLLVEISVCRICRKRVNVFQLECMRIKWIIILALFATILRCLFTNNFYLFKIFAQRCAIVWVPCLCFIIPFYSWDHKLFLYCLINNTYFVHFALVIKMYMIYSVFVDWKLLYASCGSFHIQEAGNMVWYKERKNRHEFIRQTLKFSFGRIAWVTFCTNPNS